MAKKSPIKEPSQRQAGQSLREEIDRLWTDRALLYVAIAVFAIVLASLEWWRFLTSAPPEPVPITIAAIVTVLLATVGLARLRKRFRSLQLGLEGERAVADILDHLKGSGARVFHDVVADKFNIDHVVISSSGIYAIETKTVSKQADEKIRFENSVLWAGSRNLGSDHINQAKASASWLADDLKAGTGKSYPVRPCLVYPGWYVEPIPSKLRSEIWILSPKALEAFIINEADCLSEADLHAAAYHLRMRERHLARQSA